MALLAGLHMLFVATATGAARLLVTRRSLLRVGIIVGVLVALLAGFDVLIVGPTLGSHDVSPLV